MTPEQKKQIKWIFNVAFIGWALTLIQFVYVTMPALAEWIKEVISK